MRKNICYMFWLFGKYLSTWKIRGLLSFSNRFGNNKSVASNFWYNFYLFWCSSRSTARWYTWMGIFRYTATWTNSLTCRMAICMVFWIASVSGIIPLSTRLATVNSALIGCSGQPNWDKLRPLISMLECSCSSRVKPLMMISSTLSKSLLLRPSLNRYNIKFVDILAYRNYQVTSYSKISKLRAGLVEHVLQGNFQADSKYLQSFSSNVVDSSGECGAWESESCSFLRKCKIPITMCWFGSLIFNKFASLIT